MFLKKFIYVNWGNIPNSEFEMGPINLFSGGNGSGKTTAADAIQTVMTAAHENLFQYNPGQDETTQRGRGGKQVRTLASYVLGCDDGSFARVDPTDGYLAAVFHPTKGESGMPFTAVLGVRARLEKTGDKKIARQEDSLFLILPEVELTLGHLQREDSSGQYITPMDGLTNLLMKEFGQRAVQKYDTKKAYLRRLYGALRGKSDMVTEREATHAAKTFSRFMAYKKIDSIDQFVAAEILEPKDMGDTIKEVSGLLKTIHGMTEEAERLVHSIDVLQKGRNSADSFIDHWLEQNTLQYQLARHHQKLRQKDYIAAKQEQTRLKKALVEADSEIETAQQRWQQVDQQRIDLEAQRRGVGALQEKDQLEADKTQGEQLRTECFAQLLTSSHALDGNLTATQTIVQHLQAAHIQKAVPLLGQMSVLKQGKELIDKGQRAEIDFVALQNSDLTGDLAHLEQHLDQARQSQSLHNQWLGFWRGDGLGEEGLSPQDALKSERLQTQAQYDRLQKEQNQKQEEIRRLEQSKVSYPPYVEKALEAIRISLPGADPRVLCDHIEVTDERWQMAIEGYLGNNRFAILVAPEHEAEAIRLVRRLPGRDSRAKVVQGEKAARDAQRAAPRSNSVLHVLDFSHAVAQAYFTASYASLERVDSADELRHSRRGITADGMASGGYAMFRCDIADADLVFGQGARQRALAAKKNEWQQLSIQWQQCHDQMQQLVEMDKAVARLQALNYADSLDKLLSSHRELLRIETLLAQLDLSEYADLEQQLTELLEQQQHWGQEKDRLNQQKGKDSESLERVSKQCQRLGDEQERTQEAAEQWEDTLHSIADVWPDFNAQQRMEAADQQAEELIETIAQQQLDTLKNQYQQCRWDIGTALDEHNRNSTEADRIIMPTAAGDYDIAFFKQVCGLQRQIDGIYNRYKNNILVEKQRALGEYRESFNHSFVSNFCHTLYQALEDGKRQIEALNDELQHHRFGADRESFRFDHSWKAEFEDYQKFFRHVVRNPSLDEGKTLFDMDLNSKLEGIRSNLMDLLLGDDEQRALQELGRIADYRNYRHYEIYKMVEGKPDIPLSQYGTGSGGQLETPAYIIRAAAVTSAFKFKEGNSHLRMVLVDEAFSKMDEGRSREVMSYLTDALGLQLSFIMPTSKCGPFMDLISNQFVFAKCPSDRLRGELKTQVFVDKKAMQKDKVAELWKKHKRVVYEQASLDFMEDVLGESA